VRAAHPTHADDLIDRSIAETAGDEPGGPRTRISLLRVLIALVVIAGLASGGVFWVRDRHDRATARQAVAAEATAWFAPYVDTTLTPTLQFQDPSANPARQVVLGFVVADPKSACSPSWGTYYSLTGAASQLNLDRRIAQLQDQGSSAVVSFGGQSNSELAVSCTDTAKLTAAYQSVVSRYSLTTIDLDLEGAALDDQASIVRRAVAIAALQKQAKAAKKPLNVWLTLPVEPNGLQSNALAVTAQMLTAGVQLSGVNIMAMDFTSAQGGMSAAISSALSETHSQLTALYRGANLTSAQVWNRIGVTIMIGQNDVAGQNVSVSDANQVVAFANAQHLGRVSMWSLNRDTQCGSRFARIGVHSNTCSGTSQKQFEFSQVLGALTGTVPANVPAANPSASAPADPGGIVVDDPAHAPFPIWNPGASYPGGYKVVRQGYVYQAKWYNTALDPAAASASSSDTPWQVVGPVLASDHPPVLPTLAAGTYPAWLPTVAYPEGQKVLRNGLPYQAKYYGQGDDPVAVMINPAGSQWKALYTIPGEPVAAG
jgi:chitinase